jgi:hypothetical protein
MSIILAPLFLANSITLLGVLIIFWVYLVSYVSIFLVAASFRFGLCSGEMCSVVCHGLQAALQRRSPSRFTIHLFFYCCIRRTVLAPPPTVTQHSAGEIGFRSYQLNSLTTFRL